jgi:hypothetical protein
VVKSKAGKRVRNKDLGWLKPGNHKATFRCGTLRGTLFVFVHGVAKNLAKKNSPVRKVRC